MELYHSRRVSCLRDCHPLYPIQVVQCRGARECKFIDRLRKRAQQVSTHSRRLHICICLCDPMLLQKASSHGCPNAERRLNTPTYDILVIKKIAVSTGIQYFCYEVELKTTISKVSEIRRIEEKFRASCMSSVNCVCHEHRQVVVYSELEDRFVREALSKEIELLHESEFLERLMDGGGP